MWGYCIMAARVQRAVMPGWISRLPEIDKDVVFKIVIELKKAKGWKRIQWKAVAEHYIRETGKDATPDKAFQKKVRRAFQDYVYDSKKHLHDGLRVYEETGDTSLLKEVLYVDSVGKLDINVPVDELGMTLLYVASWKGHSEVVSMLLAKQGVKVNKAETVGGYTPLYIASHGGQTEGVKLLLAKQDIDVNKAANDGATPLYIASEKGHAEVVKLLLAKEGIDVNQVQNDGATPLLIASEKGRADVVSLLLAKEDIDVNKAEQDGWTPLYIASRNDRTEVVSLLLAKQDIDVNHAASNGGTALIIASQNGNTDVVSMLLAKQGIDVNKAVDSDNSTPLLIACINGHLPVVKKLLARADILPNEADNNGKTPLIAACLANNGDIVHELINDSRVDPNKANGRSWPALTLACEKGRLKAVEAMLGSPMVDVNKTTDRGVTAIFIACQNGHTKVVETLLQDTLVPIDINAARDSDDSNPLLIACERKRADIVKALMNADPAMITSPLDFTKVTNKRETALHCAIRLDTDAIAYGGSDVERLAMWVKIHMINVQRLAIVKMLLTKRSMQTKLNAKMNRHETALFWACKNGLTQVVEELLKHKSIKLNSKNGRTYGATALVIAIRKKHVAIVKMLLAKPGIKPNARTSHGDSPFYLSLINPSSEILTALLTWVQYKLSRDLQRSDNDLMRMAKSAEIKQAYTTGHRLTWNKPGSWALGGQEAVQPEDKLAIHLVDGRLRPADFRNMGTTPTKTFTLNARDVTMFTDEIDAPVRCVPCQHPHEASSLHRWLNTPMNPDNPNRLHKGCPLCQQEPEWVEFMTELQVERWNNMEKASSKYEQELNRLRPLMEKSSSMGVYKQFQASTSVLASNEAKAQELEKERKDIEEQIRKLREKRGEVLHAASDVQTVVDRTNVALATLQSQLDRDPEFKKNVEDSETARRAVDKNKLQNRYTPGKKTTLKF